MIGLTVIWSLFKLNIITFLIGLLFVYLFKVVNAKVNIQASDSRHI